MKTKKLQKRKPHVYKWTIRISDGYCEYVYHPETVNGNVSIFDVYDAVCSVLHAKKKPGIFVCNTNNQ